MTGIIVYVAALVSKKGDTLIGSVISTFPIALMVLLTLSNKNIIDNFIKHITVSNSIIVISWLTVYLNTKENNALQLASIGFITWFILNLIYLIYLYFAIN
tara:strand:- start:320 stop:622 length:303 start_codon:yes stop_codon:yes gene_type:complete